MADPFSSFTQGFLQTLDPSAVGSALGGPKASTILQLYGVKQRQRVLALQQKKFTLDARTAVNNIWKIKDGEQRLAAFVTIAPSLGLDPKENKALFKMFSTANDEQAAGIDAVLADLPQEYEAFKGSIKQTFKLGGPGVFKFINEAAAATKKVRVGKAAQLEIKRLETKKLGAGDGGPITEEDLLGLAGELRGQPSISAEIERLAGVTGEAARAATGETRAVAGETREVAGETRAVTAATQATTAATEATEQREEEKIAAATMEKLQRARILPAGQMSRSSQIQEIALILSGVTPDQHTYRSAVGKSISQIKNRKVRLAAAQKQLDILSSTNPMKAAIANYMRNNPQFLGGGASTSAKSQTSSSFIKLLNSFFK
jgi:hypothetical protein